MGEYFNWDLITTSRQKEFYKTYTNLEKNNRWAPKKHECSQKNQRKIENIRLKTGWRKIEKRELLFRNRILFRERVEKYREERSNNLRNAYVLLPKYRIYNITHCKGVKRNPWVFFENNLSFNKICTPKSFGKEKDFFLIFCMFQEE